MCGRHRLICLLESWPSVKNVTVITGNENVSLEQMIMQLYDHLLSQAVLPAHSSFNVKGEWVLHRHLVECSFAVEAETSAKPQGPCCGQQACQRLYGNCRSCRLEFRLLLKTSTLKTYMEAKSNSHMKPNTTWPSRPGVLLPALNPIKTYQSQYICLNWKYLSE